MLHYIFHRRTSRTVRYDDDALGVVLLHEAWIRVRDAPARHLLTPRSIWRCRWLSRVRLLGASANILALGPTLISPRRPSRRFGRGAIADEGVPAETKHYTHLCFVLSP